MPNRTMTPVFDTAFELCRVILMTPASDEDKADEIEHLAGLFRDAATVAFAEREDLERLWRLERAKEAEARAHSRPDRPMRERFADYVTLERQYHEDIRRYRDRYADCTEAAEYLEKVGRSAGAGHWRHLRTPAGVEAVKSK